MVLTSKLSHERRNIQISLWQVIVKVTTKRFGDAQSNSFRMAICLWVLATPTEYRTTAHLFGVARFSVYHIVHEAIVDILLHTNIRFPSGTI